MSVLVIDYGMGNLFSLMRSLEVCGIEATLSDDPQSIERFEKAILPGVGAFADAMQNLTNRGWCDAIRAAVTREDFRLLGICLGMQLLAEVGIEGGECAGLNLIPGKVVRLSPSGISERIPHMGWNEIEFPKSDPLFSGIPNRSDFYFCHSFHFVPARSDDVLAVTDYCGKTVAAVGKGNVQGVQFHPEKSSKYGQSMLKNFCASY